MFEVLLLGAVGLLMLVISLTYLYYDKLVFRIERHFRTAEASLEEWLDAVGQLSMPEALRCRFEDQRRAFSQTKSTPDRILLFNNVRAETEFLRRSDAATQPDVLKRIESCEQALAAICDCFNRYAGGYNQKVQNSAGHSIALLLQFREYPLFSICCEEPDRCLSGS